MKRTHLLAREYRDTFGHRPRMRAVGVCGEHTTRTKATDDKQRVTCKDCIKKAGIIFKCGYKTCDNAATGTRVVLLSGKVARVRTCDACAARLDARMQEKRERLAVITLADNFHPDDAAIAKRMLEVSIATAAAFELPLRVVEHKRRPHSGGAYGLCYVNEGRISIVVRFRDGSNWWAGRLAMSDVWHTVAHELAHLRVPRDNAEHRAFERVVLDWMLATFADVKECFQ